MTLKVIGAGLSRVGTTSLRLALERLLGARCYHMNDVFAQPNHVSIWHAAAQGRMPDWQSFLASYTAVVGWPAAAFWQELSQAFPDALILLAVRDPLSWWHSVHTTIFPATQAAAGSEWHAMFEAVLATRFTNDLNNQKACLAAYECHNALVRNTAPPHRLCEWHLGEGWTSLCAGLKMPVPDEPFPHANTREEFLDRFIRLKKFRDNWASRNSSFKPNG